MGATGDKETKLGIKMSKEIKLINTKNISSKIYTIRGMQVMFDRDLAELYAVETGHLNRAVKRNIERFPGDFMYQITIEELNNLKCHFGISSWGGTRKQPYVFTEQGVAMLSSVLKSKKAAKVNIAIMRAFIKMRKIMLSHQQILPRVEALEQKVEPIFKALEANELPKQGIFYDGQIFDAYVFVSKLIRKAKTSIILIDNYIDETVLTLLAKRKKHVTVLILTQKITRQLQLDIEKQNEQYAPVEVKVFNKSHDRFLIIDSKEIYHIGASLKDLGKKWFAFSKLDSKTVNILDKI